MGGIVSSEEDYYRSPLRVYTLLIGTLGVGQQAGSTE